MRSERSTPIRVAHLSPWGVGRFARWLVGPSLMWLAGCGEQPTTPKSSPPGTTTAKTSPRLTADSEGRLPVLGRMPEFVGTASDGKAFSSLELDGFTWIACFVPNAPVAAGQVGRLAQLSATLERLPERREVRLVCIREEARPSVPRIPIALGSLWQSVSVSDEPLRRLREQVLASPSAGDAAHSQGGAATMTMVLVDAAGRVRGRNYDLTNEGIETLTHDVGQTFDERKSVPPEAVNPTWLAERQAAQLSAARDYGVFHDFGFVDRRIESGIRFRNKIVDDAGKHYEAGHYDHGNGLAIADVDLDGREDLYFVNQVGGNELWRNLGEGRFENVTARARVSLADRIGVAASFADIDNDGDPDLYVTTVRGGNALFENDGTGRFSDISESSQTNYAGHSSGAVFFDFDRDGKLDLFVANVGRYTTDEQKLVTMEPLRGEPQGSYMYYDGVKDAFAGHLKPERAEQNRLYRNLGGNVFEDVTQAMGLVDESWCGDASPLDRNSDGWPDLYLVNMQGQDEYYENDRGERFIRRSREVFPRTPWGSMCVKSFDYDNDGDFDLFITDMHSDMSEPVGPDREKLKSDMKFPESFLKTEGNSIFGNAFFRNDGDGNMNEVSDELGAENYWPWGFSTGDINGDGFEDVFITASMNLPFRYGVNSLLLNDHGRRFLDSEFVLGVEPRRGGRTAIPWYEIDCATVDAGHLDCEGRGGRVVVWAALGSRSSVIFDLDLDGDLDIVTNDFNSEPLVLVSDLAERRPKLQYLKVRLEGTSSNRQGLGAVIRVKAGDRTWTKAHDGKSGYLSQSAQLLYFGLDEASQVDTLEVRWPSGKTQTVAGPIEANTLVIVREEP
ncbi:MAG: CRTAC1 family protein [Planctomycetaceae bacterium]|nr:CRTAC1 family protein [Planctomycetaceae bacterium]